ncbi:hypothetical protein QYY77_10050 [Xanthomonas campestris pv. campestris]|uniref:hypothetical protein n=1 Tax=Xanthomonas campestris TaxID=339 RepID=UPI002AD56A50|nr:hypothetical protein [Xanthomonas campestris]MEA0736423.1 hypothetical protein [Xanthomonas campestris pv. campestris]
MIGKWLCTMLAGVCLSYRRSSVIEPNRDRRSSTGQRCEVWIMDVAEAQARRIFVTDAVMLEAPNWLPSGEALLLNGNGKLFQLTLDRSELRSLEIEYIPPVNNDHVVDRLGRHVYLSADDGHIYRAVLDGERAGAKRASQSEDLMHFLHGIHPTDGRLSFVGVRRIPVAGEHPAQIYTMTSAGSDYRQLTRGPGAADGCEYSPDGEWIYFSSECFDGHMQIGRMRCDGTESTQLTFDQCSNWFPHISPDGCRIAYLAYAPGTTGHPGEVWVDIRLVEDHEWQSAKTVGRVFGGQGTMNVNSWSPDSKQFAYVTYAANQKHRVDSELPRQASRTADEASVKAS